MKKQQKPKLTHFSSEDSQNTDHSMDSSLEIAESSAQNNSASKFNQLRETMNQLFLANPELADEIKFDKHFIGDDADMDSPKHHLNIGSASSKKGASNLNDALSGLEEPDSGPSTSKFWSVISKEMTKPQKNSKMPSLSQINHILNIYKMKIERPENTELGLSPTKTTSVLKKPKQDFRVQSAKLGGDKLSNKAKEGKLSSATSPQSNNPNALEEEEDGVKYYSFRKKMHLKLKHKRLERELEEQMMRKEMEAEREKQMKEREQKMMMTTLAELDEEMKKGIQAIKSDEDDAVSSRNAQKAAKQRGGSRKNSLKPKGDIFERLTKDINHKSQGEEEEEPGTKRAFLSTFAENLYKDMKAFGDAEAFKKVAQTRIINYKKDFKEKLAKQKQLPTEGLRFSKEKSRHLNMFVPDFEKTMNVPNKETIFLNLEVQRDSDEWKENPEYEILAKFQKLRQGNILEFWQDTKDLNQ